MMSKNNWLYDENGKVRKELYQMSRDELDAKQVAIANDDYSEMESQYMNDALRKLESGDTIYIRPDFTVASDFGGRMTFIQFHGIGRGGVAMFCRTENGGGGFIGSDMLVDINDPQLLNTTKKGHNGNKT